MSNERKRTLTAKEWETVRAALDDAATYRREDSEELATWDPKASEESAQAAEEYDVLWLALGNRGPPCGHSACSQNYIDTGSTDCIAEEDEK